MKIFHNKVRRKLCALILVVSILASALYNNEIFAENNQTGMEALSESLQTQVLNIQVSGNNLSGKHEYADIELADYKDSILMTLDDETIILGEETFTGDVYKNETSLYGDTFIMKADESTLTKSIVAENDISFTSNSITTVEEESSILYSKKGNIKLQADSILFNGILYAPEAAITLTGKNIQINGALIAKSITIESDEFEMNGYSDNDMKKLEWVQEPEINSNYTTIDEEKRELIFHLENYEEVEIFVRQEGNSQFKLLADTTEDSYGIGFDEIQGISEYRTSAKRFGETSLSSIFTYSNNGKCIEEAYLDSDEDGIMDGYEIWDLGTDPYVADTDGDGFSDGYEVYVLYTDPLSITEDTDSDKDGLSDKTEMEIGTNPYLKDTDFDGITDGVDPEPMVTDVDSGQPVDYETETRIGVFEICNRYFNEDGTEFETIYNYTNGQIIYLKNEGKEIRKFYSAEGYETASIQIVEGTYIVNTYIYDENGNAISKVYNGMKYDYAYDENGNVLESNLGERILEKNSYDGEQLTETTYGNGDTQRQEYDSKGNLVKTFINGEVAYEWEYNGNRPVFYQDHLNDKTYTYEYNEEGYLIKTVCSDGFIVEYLGDEDNQEVKYSYGSESISKTVNVVEECEDSLQVELSNGEDIYVATIENDTLETHFVTAENTIVAENEKEITDEQNVKAEVTQKENIEYQYDDAGNITEVKKDGVVTAVYEYDSLGQLVREDLLENGTTTINEYDISGNILCKTEYELDMEADSDGFTNGDKTQYVYEDDSWRDLLTEYNGNDIIYDEIGNPTSYYNGMEFEWAGKQLVSVQKDGKTVTYTYDADGLRTSKNVDGKQTEFFWENGELIGEYRDEGIIWYMHDVSGSVVGFQFNEVSYYFNKNLQGDVLSILDSEGTVLVEYSYDAWGNVIEISGDETLGELNPIRYRGYYQDNETGFYYLQKRYYDTETGRFLNTDSQLDFEADNAAGNLFTYAANNSVMRVDPTGESSALVYIGAILVTLILVYYLSVNFVSTWYKNADKIASAMERGFRKISANLSYYSSMAKALWREYAKSFAKAKKTYSGKEYHHIVAKGAYKAKEARNALYGVGISVDSNLNMIWLKKGLHKRVHTNNYYRMTNEIVVKCYNMTTDRKKRENNVKGALKIMKQTLTALDKMAPF